MTSVILPSRSPSGSPVYAPTSRPVYRGGASAAPAGFAWSQYFGGSDDGFVLDGTESRFYTDSGMTTLATTSGSDPVGAIEDLSGKGNNALMGTSYAKPIFYDDGTIKHIAIGSLSGNARFMTFTPELTTSAAFTIIAVFKNVVSGSQGSGVLSNFRGNWDPSGYFILRQYAGNCEAVCSTSVTFQQLAMAQGDIRTALWVRSGTGTNQSALTLYQTDGTQVSTGTATQAGAALSYITIGQSGSGFGETRVAFLMYISRALTAQEQTDIRAELVTRFGAFAP